MPKKKNLDLAEAMGEDVDVTEEEANDANQIVVATAEPPVAPPAVVPSQPMAITVADIQAIVKTAVEAAQTGNAAMAEAVTQGIAQQRKPIPEGTDASNPRISTMNPFGDRDHPRPELKCEFFIGMEDSKGQVQPSIPWLTEDLSVYEVVALNTLEPIKTKIRLTDETEIKLSVLATKRDHLTDEILRMVLVVPQYVIEKKSLVKNTLPPIPNIVEQITGVDYRKLSGDEMVWLMKEHRNGNYVARREEIAA